MVCQPNHYWKSVCGVELFKVNYYLKYWLYRCLGLKLPKLADQRGYWEKRGQVYFEEISSSRYLEREVFFQDMLIENLRGLTFDSAFEAGCGFGWNIKRFKDEFPAIRVGGLDFSLGQLKNARKYMDGLSPLLAFGDACRMPFQDKAFDVGFTVGVFMNIHPKKIRSAVGEMLRVCRRYVIHLEYDENHTTGELREKRAFKTNIVSHDYRGLYESSGAKIVRHLTHEDFGPDYWEHAHSLTSRLDRWEGFEGPEKYIFLLVEI
ncbi:MAG: class I SAM-dependent methyltransferase [Thermodesulfobacteriota bacterium]